MCLNTFYSSLLIYFHDFSCHKVVNTLVVDCYAPHTRKYFVEMKFEIRISGQSP